MVYLDIRAFCPLKIVSVVLVGIMLLFFSCSPASDMPLDPDPLSQADRILLKHLVSIARETINDVWEHELPPILQDYPYTAVEQGIIVRFIAGKTQRGCLAFYKGVGDLTLGAHIAASQCNFS